jgi:site-specific DNA-methyltransferase (adenine-specific)
VAKYLIDKDDNTVKAAFQVKGGKVQSKDTDALLGAMNKHKCELGIFLTIRPPTKPMLETIAKSGFISTPGFKYPVLQVATLEDYFKGCRLKLPPTNITFESAKLKGKGMKQMNLTI